jgi:hypothetical protein
LYESEHKRHTAPQELPAQMFSLSSPAINFLTEKRYRLLRHLLMKAVEPSPLPAQWQGLGVLKKIINQKNQLFPKMGNIC